MRVKAVQVPLKLLEAVCYEIGLSADEADQMDEDTGKMIVKMHEDLCKIIDDAEAAQNRPVNPCVACNALCCENCDPNLIVGDDGLSYCSQECADKNMVQGR
jgi:hypothetical protein